MNNHVASVRFGTRANGTYIKRLDDDNLVGKALLSAPAMNHLESVLMLREAYDCTFGIYSEDEAIDPNNVMKMHPHEDYVTDGSVMTLMDRIIRAKLPSITGMSLIDLMEMPPSLLEPLLKVANKKVEGEAASADELLSKLEE